MVWWIWIWIFVISVLTIAGALMDVKDHEPSWYLFGGIIYGVLNVAFVLGYSYQEKTAQLGRFTLITAFACWVYLFFDARKVIANINKDSELDSQEKRDVVLIFLFLGVLVLLPSMLVGIYLGVKYW